MKGPTVVKLGGSLLCLADLGRRFDRWWSDQPHAPHLLVVGGGEAVAGLRARNAAGECDATDAHWAAIEAMRDNARALLRDGVLAGNWLERWEEIDGIDHGLALLDPVDFMRRIDPVFAGGPLPASWDVTSDSIAARVASAVGGRLVLLKSRAFPARTTPDEWSAQGWVDAAFPRVCPGLRIEVVNLRAS